MPALPIDATRLGAVATGHVEPVQVWAEVNGRRQPGDQETDQATGLPLWTVHALVVNDARPTTIAVRLPARECPQPATLQPVAFDGLVCNARLNRDKQLVTYWSAAGIAEQHAGRGRPAQQSADAA